MPLHNLLIDFFLLATFWKSPCFLMRRSVTLSGISALASVLIEVPCHGFAGNVSKQQIQHRLL